MIIPALLTGIWASSKRFSVRAISNSIVQSKMHFPAILSASEVIALKAKNEVKLIDGSWHLDKNRNTKDEYERSRIEGAVFLDIDEVAEKSSGLPHMLPTPSLFRDTMSDLGIVKSDYVVVYSTEGSFSSSRVWWMLKVFGHEKVSILNGGLQSWITAGGAVTTGEETPTPRSDYGEVQLESRYVVNWQQMLDVVEDGSAQIVDARSKARFLGEAPEPRAGLVRGHIPGSLNLPFSSLVAPSDISTFRTQDEIRQEFEDAGIILGSKVITSCGSGVSAAVLTLGLYVLGYSLDNCPIYDASWSEWGAREDLPKITPK